MPMIPVTLTDQVNEIRNVEITYDNLHPKALLHDAKTDITIRIPYSSITNKYKDYLSTIVITKELTDDEKRNYWFKPKTVSYDIYRTTELWDTLLILNYYTSISQFTPNVLRYYDPTRLKAFLNEIMIIEKLV